MSMQSEKAFGRLLSIRGETGDKPSQGTYVILADVFGYISGAPIYYRNKAICLRNNGWRVTILSSVDGKDYVSGVSEFAKAPFSFLREFPAIFTKSQRSKFIGSLVSAIDVDESSDMVLIESGTDWTAYWGELLAEAMHGRHIILLLDEDNKRLKTYLSFFDFKHRRGEFSCITPQTTIKTFEGYKQVRDAEAYSVTACCGNSLHDFSNDFSDSVVLSDFNIGSIGRLDKAFVPQIADGIVKFVSRHRDQSITIVFFGGSKGDEDKAIRSLFLPLPNVKLYISGYMWPFPKTAIEGMDVFISAAGSCSVSAKLGIPTIMMDVLGNGPIGFREDHTELYRDKNSPCPSIEHLLDEVWTGKVRKAPSKFDEKAEWLQYCQIFLAQVEKDSSNNSPPEYFDTGQLSLATKKQCLKSLICRLLGSKGLSTLKQIKHLIQR